jgi:hypothetical protein
MTWSAPKHTRKAAEQQCATLDNNDLSVGAREFAVSHQASAFPHGLATVLFHHSSRVLPQKHLSLSRFDFRCTKHTTDCVAVPGTNY